jgi:hypothetical protein
MSVEAMRAAVGEDGIDVAVKALKQIASDRNGNEAVRVNAAHLLLQYGLATYDTLGNPQVAA